MENNLDEKIDMLERETKNLETHLIASSSYTGYIFAGAIFSPFVVFFIIYNLGSMKDEDGQINRRRVLKYTIPIVLILWGLLYGLNWYLYKREN